MIKQLICVIAFCAFSLLSKGSNFSIETTEGFFKLNKTQIDSVLKKERYVLNEKDVSLGITTYKKIQGGEFYYVWIAYSNGRLKYISWDEHIYTLPNFVNEIRQTDYTVIESKTNDKLGHFFFSSKSKKHDLTIQKMMVTPYNRCTLTLSY